jgi:predicted permease
MAMKTPFNTALCICVLAGGIALATSSYKFYEMVFATTVPYKDSDRMVVVNRLSSRDNRDNWPLATYRAFAERQHVFESLLPVAQDSQAVKGDATDMQVQGAYIVPETFGVLGVHPVLGREFNSGDTSSDAPRTCLISHDLWQRLFGGSPDALGKTLTCDGIIRVVIGVMPKDFNGPFPVVVAGMWMPLNLDTVNAETGWVSTVALLGVARPGISRKEALRQANAAAMDAYAALPQENECQVGVRLRYLNDVHADGSVVGLLYCIFACTFLILLMSCGIVSGLLTARYSIRTQEMAVRSALGATRMQVIGQMILEFLVISVPALLFGLLLSRMFDVLLLEKHYDRFNIPGFMRQHDGVKMTLFILGILGLVTLFSSIMPAIRASRTNLNSILRESTRTSSSLRVTQLSNFLMLWQVATACVVLSGGAMIGSYLRSYHEFISTFNADEYLAFRLAFNAKEHPDSVAKCNEVIHLLETVRHLPSVDKACLTNELFSGNQWSAMQTRVWIDGRDYPSSDDVPEAFHRLVAPGYLDALNIPLLQGRDFTPADNEENPVAIVSEGFARQHFGGMDVIGRRFRMSHDGRFLTIIGVVPEVFNPAGDSNAWYGFFRPYAVEPWDDVYLLVRGRGSFEEVSRSVTGAIASVDSKICILETVPYPEARNATGPYTFLSFLMTLFSSFSICALVMTVGGLYGIISFVTNLKRTETGIRMALGAQPMDIVCRMTRRGLLFVLAGLLVGAGGAVLLNRSMSGLFAGTGEGVLMYCGAAALLLVVSAASIFIPAYLSARRDPSSNLRE